jgi:hypothetical protein
VQTSFGSGDYLVRGKVNGKWFRSKTFSVEGLTPEGKPGGYGTDSELDRLRLQIQQTQVQMEAERVSSLQRSHELQLALIQNHTGNVGPQMTIADMITAVKSLNDLGGQDAIDKAIERVFNLAGKVQQLTNPQGSSEGGNWYDFLKPVGTEAAKIILPKVLPFLNATPPQTMAPTPTGAISPALPQPSGLPPDSSISTSAGEQDPGLHPEASGMNSQMSEEVYLAQKREALSFALAMARLNRAPEVWADFAIEQVETTSNPVTTRFLKEAVEAPDFNAWFKDLEKIEPSIITTRGWFEAFFQTVRETLSSRAQDTPGE